MTCSIRFRKLIPEAKIPFHGSNGAAGYDLTATSVEWDAENLVLVYHTGLAVEIPKGYAGKLYPRSSIYKTSLIKTNSVGLIDSDYRGEILMKFATRQEFPAGEKSRIYQPGDRIGQLTIEPVMEVFWVEADELTGTERGTGGYGSTGK